MRDRLDEFDELSADVVVVTFARPRVLAGYQQRFATPLPVVSDQDRVLYRALGFGRASNARVWSPAVLARYLRLMIGGHRLSTPEGTPSDVNQLGGDAVINPDGTLSWLYPGSGPDDRPTVDALLQATSDASSV